MKSKKYCCQLTNLPSTTNRLSSIRKLFQISNKLKRMLKRRVLFLQNYVKMLLTSKKKSSESFFQDNYAIKIKPGDLVKIRSREEIKSSLNHWNQLKGCAFMEEMWQYCNGKYRVFKKVNQFLDERDYLVKKCDGIFLLEGLICEGTKDFGRCDRACFYFWRKEWLEKVTD